MALARLSRTHTSHQLNVKGVLVTTPTRDSSLILASSKLLTHLVAMTGTHSGKAWFCKGICYNTSHMLWQSQPGMETSCGFPELYAVEKNRGLFSTHIMVTFIATTGMSWSCAPSQSSSRSRHWHSSGTIPSTGDMEWRRKGHQRICQSTGHSAKVPKCQDWSYVEEQQSSAV